MRENIVADLFRDYKRHRHTRLTQEQFASFLAFFPSLLVVASDGIVDKEEWLYCKKLAKALGHSFSDDMVDEQYLTSVYKREFGYLLKNLPAWESRFLSTLKQYLIVNQYAKQFVIDTLYLFADASNGISESEQLKIKYIKEVLSIEGETNLY